MDSEILQAIKIIDKQIASLQEARKGLAIALGIDEGSLANGIPAPTVPKVCAEDSLAARKPRAPISGGRKVELADFLLKHGPMSRVAIVEQSKLPEGTVSYCLSDKRFFLQNEGGDWDITDFSRTGLERRVRTGTFHVEGQV